MQTRFNPSQLADPDTAACEQILRKCVHCGFCTATCPTYVLLGDELDSPRGRIYLVKDMLENDRPATAEVVQHVDRCLSCLACMTTCPSGVHFQHLIDHARIHVERTYRRPLGDRVLRALLAAVLPYPRRFAAALRAAAIARPLAPLLPQRVRAMLELAERPAPAAEAPPQGAVRAGAPRMRVAVLTGCVQPVVAPEINAATVRLLERAGAEVVEIGGCCGALVHHLGRAADNRSHSGALIGRLHGEMTGRGLDAVVANASGCGTHVKDYGFVFREDPALAEKAAAVSRIARDVTEVLVQLGLPPVTNRAALRIAYHSACSMQHGQRVEREPRDLLAAAGFDVQELGEAHLCCGSAGTYNILQPDIAGRLRERKLGHIAARDVHAVATGNIGCIRQLRSPGGTPILHTVELLDFATGGPPPAALGELKRRQEVEIPPSVEGDAAHVRSQEASRAGPGRPARG